MRIGLLSDTHIPVAAKELPPELMVALQGVDLILHGGDIYNVSVLDELERIAPVLAARGDDDHGDTVIDQRVKEKHILEFEGKRLWLVHERPYAFMFPGRQNTVSSRQDNKPDIIVFGHEHRTVVQRVDGTLLINPGSPTFLNYLRGLGTIGILDINSGEAEIRIQQL